MSRRVATAPGKIKLAYIGDQLTRVNG